MDVENELRALSNFFLVLRRMEGQLLALKKKKKNLDLAPARPEISVAEIVQSDINQVSH